MTKYIWKGDPKDVELCDIQNEKTGECLFVRGLICPGFIKKKCCFSRREFLEGLSQDIIDNLERIEE